MGQSSCGGTAHLPTVAAASAKASWIWPTCLPVHSDLSEMEHNQGRSAGAVPGAAWTGADWAGDQG